MRSLCFFLLIMLSYPSVANAETQTYNFTLQNNTALNFDGGYYIIEVIGVNSLTPKYAKLNLTTSGQSKTYNIYESELSYLSSPFDRIDITATSITGTSVDLKIEFPAEWTSPEKYMIERAVSSRIPDILITKSADKTDVKVGEIVEIKITVENTGNGTADNLVLKETFPVGFTGAPGSRFPPEVRDKLDPEEKQELYYALKPVESGTFKIEPTTITYGSRSSKSNPLTITVAEVTEEESNLTTVISQKKNNVKTDDPIEIAIKITNTGKVPAESILVEGTIPQGLVVTEGDLRQVYKRIDPGESEEYTVTLKAQEPGNYSISLKTIYNDDPAGTVSSSEPIVVTKREKEYLYIIIPVGIIVIGIVLFTLKRHREYSY